MRKYVPTVIRYGIGGILILVITHGILDPILFISGLIFKVSLQDSPLTVDTVLAIGTDVFRFITTPSGLIILGIGSILVAFVGQQRYENLLQFIQRSLHRIDDILGYSLFDDSEVEGRVCHNEVAWRCQYWEDGHINVLRRECPFCGLELVESYLPRHIVFEPNTAFDPGEESRETATEAWHDVFGEETAEDRDEVSALACPQCNFSVPGEKSVLEGNDGAQAKFEQHIQIMKTGNPRSNPFEEYSDVASEKVDGNRHPVSIWNEYVAESPSDDVLSIGAASEPETSSQETPKQTLHRNAS